MGVLDTCLSNNCLCYSNSSISNCTCRDNQLSSNDLKYINYSWPQNTQHVDWNNYKKSDYTWHVEIYIVIRVVL